MTMLPPPPRTGSTTGPPPAPGGIGVAIEPPKILAYLTAISAWRDGLYATLEQLDQRAQRAAGFASLTTDMTLAYAVWQSINDRIAQITTTWDSGRVQRKEREEIAGLIWGRLHPKAGGGLPVSLVEACVLADALVGQLRTRIDADALAGSGDSARLPALREQLSRCRTMAKELGEPLERVEALTARLEATTSTIATGINAKGALDQLDLDLSALERDLIVGASTSQRIDRDTRDAQQRLVAMVAFEQQARAVAARCIDKIAHPPKLAVPSVAALGPVPSGASTERTAIRLALDAYLTRLALVDKALHQAQDAYQRPLAERDDLRGVLESYRAMAGHRGHGEDPVATALFAQAKDVLWSAPCDLAEARRLVAAYQQIARVQPVVVADAVPPPTPMSDLVPPMVAVSDAIPRTVPEPTAGVAPRTGPPPTDALPTDHEPEEH